jgi:hypothetical protein
MLIDELPTANDPRSVVVDFDKAQAGQRFEIFGTRGQHGQSAGPNVAEDPSQANRRFQLHSIERIVVLRIISHLCSAVLRMVRIEQRYQISRTWR